MFKSDATRGKEMVFNLYFSGGYRGIYLQHFVNGIETEHLVYEGHANLEDEYKAIIERAVTIT